VVERRAQVRPQITAVAARAESCVRSNAHKCGRTQITARAGCRLRANVGCCVGAAACDRDAARVRGCSVRATVVRAAC
jgi:hypothetical protein